LSYATWTACGVVLASVFAKAIFHEPVTRTTALGLALIAAAVVTAGLGADAAG
jgi:small multidrug resistance pump